MIDRVIFVSGETLNTVVTGRKRRYRRF